MNLSLFLISGLLALQPEPADPAPAEAAAPADEPAPPEGAPAAGETPAEDVAAPAEAAAPTAEVVAPAEETPAPEPVPESATPAPAEPAPPVTDGERYIVSEGAGGPPFYDEADTAALRARHGIEVEPLERTEGPRWRCLIADPACGRSFEVNALAAYTYRGRQGRVDGMGEDPRWSSGRAQYDFWMNLPVMTEIVGDKLFSRMTLGPKGGLTFSDGGSTWGNLGMAFRYWMGRGRWAPTIEFSSALTFKVGERPPTDVGEPKWKMTRGPLGFTADVGFGLGGFGAIVVGGQYDSPLAREEIPDQYRTSAGGAFFIGFRGNILWGGPAAAAVATHVATQRTVEAP